MPQQRIPLVVITGPTASGKSALAMEMAQKYNGEIICADSRTIYRGMDIGTAKPSLQDRKQIRHHLLDIMDPDQSFSAAQFKQLALQAIADIGERGKLPILVGGTGLYVDAVIFDFAFGPPADSQKRAWLQSLTAEELQQLCLELGVMLPINARNKRHLIRALELGGQIVQPKKLRPQTVVVSLATEKEQLRSKITQRAKQMAEQGVLNEVKYLGERYGWEAEALTGNIYRTLKPVVFGKEDIAVALQKIIQSDMQLAKRQITWLKRNPYVIWGKPDQLKLVIEHFLQQNSLSESMPPTTFSATIAEKR